MTESRGDAHRFTLPTTITDAMTALQAGTATAVELVTEFSRRADQFDAHLGVFLHRSIESALAAAQAVDDARRRGEPVGPLAGVPLAVKDIIATRDAPTTAQSRTLDRSFGHGTDAPAVARLRSAGAIIVGKVTTQEYATGMPDVDAPFPLPLNPWSTDHWAGGSSSGTASGVAARLFLGGLGTDTAGSIRVPAAWCAVTGLRPTFGRVPVRGCVPVGYTQDTVGPMARTAQDCAVLLTSIAGYDSLDPSSADIAVSDFTVGLDEGIDGMRIGAEQISPEQAADCPELIGLYTAALAQFERLGATIEPLHLPLKEELSTAALVTYTVDAFAHHRNSLRRDWSRYGSSTRMSIALGALATGADYVQAQRVRRVGCRSAAALFERVDVVISPTCFAPAPRMDELGSTELLSRLNTLYWTSLGLPAMSVPMGRTAAGLPLGLQLAGNAFEEAALLRVAHTYQKSTDHHREEPPLSRPEGEE